MSTDHRRQSRLWTPKDESDLLDDSKTKNLIELAIKYRRTKEAIKRKLIRLRMSEIDIHVERQRCKEYYYRCRKARGLSTDEVDDGDAPLEYRVMNDKFCAAMKKAHPELLYKVPELIPEGLPVRIYAATHVYKESVLAVL